MTVRLPPASLSIRAVLGSLVIVLPPPILEVDYDCYGVGLWELNEGRALVSFDELTTDSVPVFLGTGMLAAAVGVALVSGRAEAVHRFFIIAFLISASSCGVF